MLEDGHQTPTSYGDISIAGSAHAHLGDQYVSQLTQNLSIYLQSPESTTNRSLAGFNFSDARTSGLSHRDGLRFTTDRLRALPRAAREDAERCLSSLLTQAARLAPILGSIQQGTRQKSLDVREASLPSIRGPCSGTCTENETHLSTVLSSGKPSFTNGNRTTRTVRQKRVNDFLAFASLFLALFLYRTASTDELLGILSKLHTLLARIRDEKLASCMSTFLALLAFHFLQQAQSARSLTEYSGDCVYFEDMYGICSSVPLAVFSGFHTFEGWLKDRYKGSNAEEFIWSGNYNINIGRRDGPILDVLNRIDNQSLLPRLRLVMAVFWAKTVCKCPDCSEQIQISAGNWLSWYVLIAQSQISVLICTATSTYCRRQFLVRETAPASTKPYALSLPASQKYAAQRHQASNSNDYGTGDIRDAAASGAIRFGSLRNIDFNVSQITLVSTTESNTDESSSSSEYDSDDLWGESEEHDLALTLEPDTKQNVSLDDRIKQLLDKMPFSEPLAANDAMPSSIPAPMETTLSVDQHLVHDTGKSTRPIKVDAALSREVDATLSDIVSGIIDLDHSLSSLRMAAAREQLHRRFQAIRQVLAKHWSSLCLFLESSNEAEGLWLQVRHVRDKLKGSGRSAHTIEESGVLSEVEALLSQLIKAASVEANAGMSAVQSQEDLRKPEIATTQATITAVAQIVAVTNTTNVRARQYLQATDGNVEEAVTLFYESMPTALSTSASLSQRQNESNTDADHNLDPLRSYLVNDGASQSIGMCHASQQIYRSLAAVFRPDISERTVINESALGRNPLNRFPDVQYTAFGTIVGQTRMEYALGPPGLVLRSSFLVLSDSNNDLAPKGTAALLIGSDIAKACINQNIEFAEQSFKLNHSAWRFVV